LTVFRRWYFLLFLAALFLAGTVYAQSGVRFENVTAVYEFGKQVTFTAEIRGEEIRKVTLFVQADGEPQARTYVFQPRLDKTYVWTLSLVQDALPPFARVRYWYGVETDAGNVLSPRYSFNYVDDRFDWQELAGDQVTVHWYAGDLAFGQAALEIAAETVRRMRPLAPVPDGFHLDVYLYASYEDMAGTLGEGTPAWVGSHAYPGLSTALVVAAPEVGQRAHMEKQIPHEVMHILLDVTTDGRAGALPAWLREGLASLAEWTPDAEYARALESAAGQGALLPIADLCVVFPLDSSGAYLAYAESDSFVRYLRGQYGDDGLQRLSQAYAAGRDCNGGIWTAFGVPLDLLDYRWREATLQQNLWGILWRDLGGYLVLWLLVLLIPFFGFFRRK
jgi:hypothetical protein